MIVVVVVKTVAVLVETLVMGAKVTVSGIVEFTYAVLVTGGGVKKPKTDVLLEVVV